MRLLRSVPVPWTPYAATFSRDGTRLAIGGGAFYGTGGILIVDLASEQTALFPCLSLPFGPDSAPSISGLCFSADDRFLVASAWRRRHNYAPTLLFAVSEFTLTPILSLEARMDGKNCPTGVLLSARHVVTRNHYAPPDRVLVRSEIPHELDVKADTKWQHLTHSRLAVVRNQAITAGRGLMSSDARAASEFRKSDRVQEGLVAIGLVAEACTPQLIPMHGCREVTAIVATPDAHAIVTGGSRGELDRWTWSGHWRQERLRKTSWDSRSVIGMCYLCGGRHLVTVSASSRLDLLAEHVPVGSWRLLSPGSPRALAAHPVRNWVAVGMKQSGWHDPRGVVDLIEIDAAV